MLAFSNVIRDLHRQAGETAQKKQQRDYESSYKSSASNDSYTGAEVLLRNNKRKDRKGGKFTLSDITKNSLHMENQEQPTYARKASRKQLEQPNSR